MPASIKRNQTEPSDEGARCFPGITAGKDYPVQGFSGGGVVVINDDGKFFHVSFADVDADWTVSVKDDATKKTDDKKTAPVETTQTEAIKTTT